MESKVLCVFYDENCYPFKDSNRSVRYPIIGNAFNGANNTTQIRFYVDQIGGTVNAQWVAVTKLPNGQIGTKVLENSALDSELGEYYVTLDLSTFYTSLKGDIYISLNGYQGGVNYEEDDGIYSIYGTPTIQATGSIKLAINYAPQMFQTTHFATDDLQQILGLFSQYQKIENSIVVIGNIATADLSGYDNGQLFFNLNNQTYYVKNELATPQYQVAENGNGILGSEHTLVRYSVNVNDYIQQLNNLLFGRVAILKTILVEYLCFVYFGNSLTERKIRLINLSDLSTYVNTYDTTQLTTISSLISGATRDNFLHESNYKSFAVPYTGATGGVDLGDNGIIANAFNIKTSTKGLLGGLREDEPSDSGNYDLFLSADWGKLILSADSEVVVNGVLNSNYKLIANEIDIGSSYYQIGLVGSDLVIGTGTGSIYLQPSSKLYYGSNEIATIPQLLNAQTTLQYNINKSGHSLAISGGADTDYAYTITLKDKDNLAISTITFDLPLESVVVSGSYDSDNEQIVLTLQDGSTIDIPVGDLVSGLVSQNDFNTLSATVTANNNNAFKYTDITITGGYVSALKKNSIDYPVASSVTTYTTPKVVATTSDLPAENDGYLYLVVADGYLYYWDTTTNDWAQGNEYATDLNQYVQTSRTIAGIDLSANISAQSLTDALVLATNTEIDNLF